MRDAGRVSDATPEIVAEQYRSFEALHELPCGSVLELDTERPLDEQVAEVTRAVDRSLAPDARCEAGPPGALAPTAGALVQGVRGR